LKNQITVRLKFFNQTMIDPEKNLDRNHDRDEKFQIKV